MLGIRHYRGVAVDLWQGDITTFVCDGMGNAANSSLAGGGGVDGAIHDAGGPTILEQCRALGGCPTGSAVATTAGNLPAKYVLHGVGPVWQGGVHGEDAALASTYTSILDLGLKHELRHLAIPAISIGAYGYPVERAASISLQAVREWIDLQKGSFPKRVTFVLYSGTDYAMYQAALFATFPE